MHQHLESFGDGGGRPGRQESGRERIDRPALGKDFTRSRLESSSRLFGKSGAAALSRKDQIPYCGIRMHDLYRKFRPLPKEVSEAIDEKDLVVASVLSGNRN